MMPSRLQHPHKMNSLCMQLLKARSSWQLKRQPMVTYLCMRSPWQHHHQLSTWLDGAVNVGSLRTGQAHHTGRFLLSNSYCTSQIYWSGLVELYTPGSNFASSMHSKNYQAWEMCLDATIDQSEDYHTEGKKRAGDKHQNNFITNWHSHSCPKQRVTVAWQNGNLHQKNYFKKKGFRAQIGKNGNLPENFIKAQHYNQEPFSQLINLVYFQWCIRHIQGIVQRRNTTVTTHTAVTVQKRWQRIRDLLTGKRVVKVT